MYETLLTREEVIQSTDQGDYFRVPLDARALDYGVYEERGERGVAQAADYDSTTTRQLDVEQTAEMLRTIPEVKALTAAQSRS
jgi:UDP-glucose 4-epimerase